MRVLVSSEHRFERTPDGSVWTADVNAYSFWTRYLGVFDNVRVLARVRDVEQPQPKWIRADGPCVSFDAVSYFVGPKQYLQAYWSIKQSIAQALTDCEAIIMRVPSTLSHTMSEILERKKHPLGLEVVGDPQDVFVEGSIRHPFRHVLSKWYASKLRMQCKEASGVAYVTAQALQRRYPCKAMMIGVSDVVLPDTSFTTSYSSIELKSKQILHASRDYSFHQCGKTTLAFVGTLAELYKSPDIVIEAVSQVLAHGFDVRLRLVGDGRYRGMLEGMAKKLGIADRCEFLGQLPGGTEVQEVLDSADMFLLPSRAEGLPRAMIEAMARGLPCIGSTVGGIPELLDPEDLVKAGSVKDLCSMIEKVIIDPERQQRMSLRNLERSREYAEDKLTKKRTDFYKHIRQVTAQHLDNNPSSARALN